MSLLPPSCLCLSRASRPAFLHVNVSLRSFPRKRESSMDWVPGCRGDGRTLRGPARTADAVAILDRPDAQQRGIWLPTDSSYVRFLVNFRPQANTESCAR